MSAPMHSVVPSDLAGGLSPALQDADALRDTYYRAVGTASVARNGFGLALIPLSAAALAVGVTGSGQGTREALAALGVTGGALYAGSVFAPGTDRQRVWLAGSQALGCAVLAMRPIIMTTTAEQKLAVDLRALVVAIASAESVFDQANEREATPLSRARKVLAAGLQLDADVNQSGLLLETRLRDIRDQVSEQILRTEPDTAAILAAAGKVRSSGAAFGLGSLPQVATAPGVTASRALPSSLADAVRQLSQATAAVSLWLSGPQAADVGRQVAQCRPADALEALPALNQAGVIELAPGASTDLPLGSASIPLSAVSGPTGVTATVMAPAGSLVLRLQAAAGAEPGDRDVILSSRSTGQELQRLTVHVAGANSRVGGGASPGNAGLGNVIRGNTPLHSTPDPTRLSCAPSQQSLKAVGLRSCDEFQQLAKYLSPDNPPRMLNEPAFQSALCNDETSHGEPTPNGGRGPCEVTAALRDRVNTPSRPQPGNQPPGTIPLPATTPGPVPAPASPGTATNTGPLALPGTAPPPLPATSPTAPGSK